MLVTLQPELLSLASVLMVWSATLKTKSSLLCLAAQHPSGDELLELQRKPPRSPWRKPLALSVTVDARRESAHLRRVALLNVFAFRMESPHELNCLPLGGLLL